MGLALALAACGSPSARGPVATPTLGVVTDPGAIAHVFIPGRGAPVVRRDGDHALVLSGPWRVELRDGRVTVSDTRTASPLEDAMACEDGWLFRAQDGLLLSSTSFLDAMRVVGEVPRGVERQPSARGLMVLARSEDEHVWLASCDGLRALAPGGGEVSAAAFATPTFGITLTWGGRLFVTRDGGARFEPIPLGGNAASRLALGPDESIEAVTARGVLRCFSDGRVDTVSDPTPAEEPAALQLDEAEEETIARTILARDPASRAALPLARPEVSCDERDRPPLIRGASRSGPASVAVLIGGGITVFDAAGRWREHPLPEDVSCPRLTELRGRTVIFGSTFRGEPVRFHRLDGDRWTSLPLEIDHPCELTVSDDGVHVAYRASCAYGAEICVASPGDGSSACVADPNGGHLRSLHGDIALLHSSDLGVYYVVLPDGSSGEVGSVYPEEDPGPPTISLVHVGWHPRGDLIAQNAAGSFFRGSREDLRPLELPEDTIHVVFGSRGRGIAIAPRRLWLTDDDGRTWNAGEVASLPLLGIANVRDRDRCDRLGCYVGEGLWVTGFRSPRAAPAFPAATPPAWVLGTAEPLSPPDGPYPTLECAAVGTPVHIRNVARADGGHTTTASMELEWTVRGHGPTRVEGLRWLDRESGRRGRGGIVGASELLDQGDARAFFRPLSSTTDGILIERCVDEDECTLHFIANGNPGEASAPPVGHPDEMAWWVDGSSLYLFADGSAYGSRIVEYSSPLSFGRTLRSLSGVGESTFARVGGRLHLASWLFEPRRLRLLDLDPSVREGYEEMPWPVDPNAIRVCPPRGPAPPTDEWDIELLDGVARFERATDGACLRSLRRARRGPELVVIAGANGLEGWEIREDALQRVRCSIAMRDDD